MPTTQSELAKMLGHNWEYIAGMVYVCTNPGCQAQVTRTSVKDGPEIVAIEKHYGKCPTDENGKRLQISTTQSV